MSKKKFITKKKVVASTKAGIAGVGITMLLLLPCSILIYSNKITMDYSILISVICGFTGTLISHLLFMGNLKGGGVIPSSLMPSAIYLLFIIVLSTLIPGSPMNIHSLMPTVYTVLLANLIGVLIKLNKSYRKIIHKQ